MTVGSMKGRNGVPVRPEAPKPVYLGGPTVSEMVDAELALDRGYVSIPPRLLPVLVAIARRQHTTVAVIVAQAISDYCEGGL